MEEPALIESVTFPDGPVSARLPFHNHLTSFVTIIYVRYGRSVITVRNLDVRPSNITADICYIIDVTAHVERVISIKRPEEYGSSSINQPSNQQPP